MDQSMNTMNDAEQYLRGVSYPATKEEILTGIIGDNAPGFLITIVESIPDKTYDNADEVIEEVSIRI